MAHGPVEQHQPRRRLLGGTREGGVIVIFLCACSIPFPVTPTSRALQAIRKPQATAHSLLWRGSDCIIAPPRAKPGGGKDDLLLSILNTEQKHMTTTPP